jgi:UDP-N-acetylglucosamine--N-acetylmuramyl-(pentapeptide) pyrophosphoryl-undecaprenol N-acetylglucosamine transferase
VIGGGGTAGHVFPALAVADELRARGWELTFVGSREGQEARLVPAATYRFVAVEAVPAQSRLSLRGARAVMAAVRGARSIRGLVHAADVVLGVGGFASAPAVLAARWARRPLVLVDQNSVPGAVNRIAARWADVVATTFAGTASRLPRGTRVERTGNPIRSVIAAVAGRRDALAAEARSAFDLDADRVTVLVVGGSLGALRLDRAIAGALSLLRDRGDLQLLVATGPAHEAIVAEALEPGASLRVRVVPFIDRMDQALAAEIAACRLPAVLVPYPHATERHQEANAREVADAGAAVVLSDEELTPRRLSACILELVDDPDRRDRMAAAALAWARPDAAQRVADLVEEAARR